MNVSMGQLVNDAKELVMRLKEREKNIDQVVVRSNALAKQIDANQQLENELISLNEKANHRSKVAVLSSIQKENKVIKLLQQENEDLKESLEEHQSVLEIIMSKYRQQMLKLIKLKKEQELTEQYYKSKIFQNLQEKTDQIAEMTEVMKKAIELDEKQLYENEEKLQMLLVENRGLKEMLKIRNKYGTGSIKEGSPQPSVQTSHVHSSQIKSNLIDQEIQTDNDYFSHFVINSNSNACKNSEFIVPFQLDDNNILTELTSTSPSKTAEVSTILNDESNENEPIDTSNEKIDVLNDSSMEAALAAVESVVVKIEASTEEQQT